MSDEREWGTTPQRVGNDGLAAMAIVLITIGLIAFVILSLV